MPVERKQMIFPDDLPVDISARENNLFAPDSRGIRGHGGRDSRVRWGGCERV
jgi:hypothetical protein